MVLPGYTPHAQGRPAIRNLRGPDPTPRPTESGHRPARRRRVLRAQAPPRAHLTRPVATAGAQRFRVPLWAVVAYLASSRRRPSRLHCNEQKRWFSVTARKSREQQSHRRSPNVRALPNRSVVGRCARQVPQMRWFPWLA